MISPSPLLDNRQKKDQVVLETAIRLRAKRIKKLNNSGTDKRFKDAALAEYRLVSRFAFYCVLSYFNVNYMNSAELN